MSADGVSTFCAVLAEFISRKDECPTVLASSHFHEIFSKNLMPICPFMEYKTTQTVLSDGNEMVCQEQYCDSLWYRYQSLNSANHCHLQVYLYQICEGRATTSGAKYTEIAAGLPASFVESSVYLPSRDPSNVRRMLKFECMTTHLIVPADQV